MTPARVIADLPARPLLPGLYQVVPMGPDRVVVANAGRTVALSGSGFTERVGPLLADLDGTTTCEELLSRFPEVAPAVLSGLAAKGLLVDAAPLPDGRAAAPQAAALALPGAPSPAEAATRLGAATVAVAGCGPVGGTVAVLLSKAGVGSVVVADGLQVTDDPTVAVSPVLCPPHAGGSRADAVAELCRQTGVEAVTTDRLAVDAPLDLAVIEVGYDEAGSVAADQCLAAGLPYLVHTTDALDAGVGPLVQPGGHPCHRCLLARRLGHVAHVEEHAAYRRHRAAISPGPDAFLAAHTSLLAGLVTTEALRALLGAEPRSRDALVVFDLGEPAVRRELLLPVPGCSGCAAAGDER